MGVLVDYPVVTFQAVVTCSLQLTNSSPQTDNSDYNCCRYDRKHEQHCKNRTHVSNQRKYYANVKKHDCDRCFKRANKIRAATAEVVSIGNSERSRAVTRTIIATASKNPQMRNPPANGINTPTTLFLAQRS